MHGLGSSHPTLHTTFRLEVTHSSSPKKSPLLSNPFISLFSIISLIWCLLSSLLSLITNLQTMIITVLLHKNSILLFLFTWQIYKSFKIHVLLPLYVPISAFPAMSSHVIPYHMLYAVTLDHSFYMYINALFNLLKNVFQKLFIHINFPL